MEDIRALVEQNYDLTVIDVMKIKNAYKISTNDGYKCLKLSRYDLGQFKFIMEAIGHLVKNRHSSILKPYSTRNGENYIKYNSGFGYMCDWVESREADYKNPIELKLCVDALGELHLASRGFTPPKESRGRNYYGRWTKRFQKRCSELLYFKALIKSRPELTEFDKNYLRAFDIHYRQALKAVSDLEGSDYIQVMEEHKKLSGLCHHDTANHNFLITKDLGIYIIDFDYCIMDSHLHDLSSIIIRNMKYGHWSMDTMQFILEVYSGRIPISKNEKYLIFCFMEFPQDFWQVGLQYYVEKQPWSEDFFIKKLNRTLEDVRDRMEFIKDLEASFMEG